MSFTSHSIVVALVCLACTSQASRVRASDLQGGEFFTFAGSHQKLEALALLFLTHNPAASFNPATPRARLPGFGSSFADRRPAVLGRGSHNGLRAQVTATSEETIVADTSSVKEDLLSAIGLETLADIPSESKQMDLNEKILALSSSNPTSEPASSPLLNGKWDVIFSGSPAMGITDSPTRQIALALYATPLSPSVLAQGLSKLPFNAAEVGDLTVTIAAADVGQPRVTAETSITLFGGEPQPVILRTNLQPQSGVALREEFIDVEAFGQRNDLPGPLALSRTLYVVYLDEDMLILRDDTGLPSVLRRADQYVSTSYDASYETTYTDDDDDGVPAAD